MQWKCWGVMLSKVNILATNKKGEPMIFHMKSFANRELQKVRDYDAGARVVTVTVSVEE